MFEMTSMSSKRERAKKIIRYGWEITRQSTVQWFETACVYPAQYT